MTERCDVRGHIVRLGLLLVLVGALSACGGDDGSSAAPPPQGGSACGGRCVELQPSDNDQETLQRAFIDARPGDVILLKAGTYQLTGQLSLDVDAVTIRGEGMDRTILSFRGQTSGAEGLFVAADNFTIEDLALEDSPGDLLKVLRCDGLTIRRVRTEWTNGPDTDNGSYGLYPIECTNVLIEESIVRGASDAGFYVGQSHNIILRRNLAEYNVAGIEIENSTDADVYENTATKNAGGILVFNLPGLPFTDGRRTRVYKNDSFENNTPNFAAAGTTVSAVPTGTGMMILANDQVEVFDNTFRDNGTTHMLLVSYPTARIIGGFSTNDRTYDQYSEALHIHDNRFVGGGDQPDPVAGPLLEGIVRGLPLPNILYDGYEDPKKLVDGRVPEALRICIQQPGATIVDFDLQNVGINASFDLTAFACAHDRLAPIAIPGVGEHSPPTPTRRSSGPTPTPTRPAGSTESQCTVRSGTGVNFDAADNPCDLLSSYRFFKGNGAEQEPNDGVTPYDLNTQLFSDYALKHRFVWMPPGTQATYRASDSFDFPVGTVIIKTFAYPVDLRDPQAGAEILETRLLVHREHGWVGLPYVWNAQKTDARLQVLGATIPVSAVQTDGVTRTFDYHVPNANQCKECHKEHLDTMGVLGPKARHLNKLYPYADGPENQLIYWTRRGLLTGAPNNPADAPRTAVFDDPSTGTAEERARGYLDVNCGHCHNTTGAAGSTGLYLTAHESDATRLGICKSPTAAGRGTGGLLVDIAPGEPDQSILVFRMVSTAPGIAMPEIGRQRVHTEAVTVIREWIASLDGACGAAPQ